jgi:hypothetical protein
MKFAVTLAEGFREDGMIKILLLYHENGILICPIVMYRNVRSG